MVIISFQQTIRLLLLQRQRTTASGCSPILSTASVTVTKVEFLETLQLAPTGKHASHSKLAKDKLAEKSKPKNKLNRVSQPTLTGDLKATLLMLSRCWTNLSSCKSDASPLPALTQKRPPQTTCWVSSPTNFNRCSLNAVEGEPGATKTVGNVLDADGVIVDARN